MNVDFLPERIKTQRARLRRLVRQGYLVVLVLVGVVFWALTSNHRVAKAQAELAMLRDRAGNVQKMLEDRARLQQQQNELMIKERISKSLGSRVNTLDMLAELERLLPQGVSLVSMNLEAVQMQAEAERTVTRRGGTVDKQAPAVTRVRLTLTGMAPNDVDVANFIGQLSASPLFEDVNMGYARTLAYQGHRAREFQASCHIVR